MIFVQDDADFLQILAMELAIHCRWFFQKLLIDCSG